jgi:hypothetical protein
MSIKTMQSQLIQKIQKEYADYLISGLSQILPVYFRIHSKLIQIADPVTHEIDCSLSELAEKMDYFPGYPFVLGSVLMQLDSLNFIKLPKVENFNERIRIKITVTY